MEKRQLGNTEIAISPIGMGCWAIGGPFFAGVSTPVGWGQVDDNESVRALHAALDLGVNFYDTADVYGCGHSERVLAQAFADRREQVVIATKFGRKFNETTKRMLGSSGAPAYVKRAVEASLRRLNTDYIDLYQFHISEHQIAMAEKTRAALEDLVAEGKIRAFAWSTDDVKKAAFFAESADCAAVQHRLNLLEDAPEILALCEAKNLTSINRGPLSKGLLTGKFSAESDPLPSDDVRHTWDFKTGHIADKLSALDAIRQILTSEGRTLAQGSLAWIWGRSPQTVPIPGFKTVAQVQENAAALEKGALSAEQMAEISAILAGLD